MRRALGSGCTGLIGSSLVERPLQAGHGLIGCDDFSTISYRDSASVIILYPHRGMNGAEEAGCDSAVTPGM